jgi:hypothetical protein
MLVDVISGHFDATMGRPTKELYSIAGLLLIQEFRDWTKDEALAAYSFSMNVHYALRPAVFHAIYLKIAGWNILRASVCAKMRQIIW